VVLLVRRYGFKKFLVVGELMKGRTWTSREVERLKEMRRDEIPVRIIAEKLCRPISAVNSKLYYLSIFDGSYTPVRRCRTWTVQEIEAAQARFDSGVPAKVIARELGVSANALYQQLQPRKRKK
jgi:hypothetical protein